MPDIGLWHRCDSRCVMCTNLDSYLTAPDRCYDRAGQLGKLERAARQGAGGLPGDGYLLLTGGEPTLHPDFLLLLRRWRETFREVPIHLLTNGRRLRDKGFAEETLRAGGRPLMVAVPLHAGDAAGHDALTRSPGSFAQTVRGLRHVLAARGPGQEVEIRVVLHRLNIGALEKTLRFLLKTFPETSAYRLVLIHFEPEGQAEKNLARLRLPLAECGRRLGDCGEILAAFRDVRIYHLPPCVLPESLRSWAFRSLPAHEVRFPARLCRGCALRPSCPGIPKRYIKVFGMAEFGAGPFRARAVRKRAAGRLPTSLAVYLSNSCNLSCANCYVAVNRGRTRCLDLKDFNKALDFFLAGAPGPDGKVSFLGGEPLLHFGLLRGAIKSARALAGEGFPIQVFTNGELLTERIIDFFRETGVQVVLGGAQPGGKGSPSEDGAPPDKVLRRASACRPRVSANIVVTPASAALLPRAAHRLYRAAIRSMAVVPDALTLWSPADCRRLAVGLDGFRRYCGSLLRAGLPAVEVANIHEILRAAESGEPDPDPSCPHLILAGDGRFYGCDKVLSAPWDAIRSFSLGSAARPADLARREEFLRSALDACRRVMGACLPAGSCPIGAYALWRAGRAVPGTPLAEWLESWSRASGVFTRAMKALTEELRFQPAFRRAHALGPRPGRAAGAESQQ